MKQKKTYLQFIRLFLGPLVALFVLFFVELDPENQAITATLAVAILMASWWITEAIPLAITSLLPIVLFPFLGIMNGKAVSSVYFNHIIFLFIGGFMMALAMEKWNLHKRIALKLLIWIGASPGRILLGFMFATAFLSMWMSNTATAMMMVPIVMSIALKLEESIGVAETKNYIKGLFFGVAYGASIGGIATLVGTPPNLSFVRIFAIMFPSSPEISFADWMFFALPLSGAMFLFAFLLLYFYFRPKKSWKQLNGDTFRQEYQLLGKTSFEEKVVFIAFISLAFLWVFRSGIRFGSFEIPGWASLFSNPKFINDGTVAIFVAIILFLIPSRNRVGERLLDWNTVVKLPWHIVLLFGGGFALAGGFAESGLSLWFGDQLSWLSDVHPLIIIFVIALLMSFLTELTSNTATTEMLLPILAGMSVSTQINPLLLMIPATLAASLAFMLPVATPPNAIVFGTNRLQIKEMVRTGFLLNLVGVLLVTLFTYYFGTYIFDIDLQVFPDWAKG